MRFVVSRLGRFLTVALAAIAFSTPAKGQGSLPVIDVIAQLGDPAPGFQTGTTHSFLNWPVQINDARELAFHGWIAGPDVGGTGFDFHVIWEVDSQGAPTAVARGGDPIPGLPGETYSAFLYFSRPMTFVSSAGEAAFVGATLPSQVVDLFGPFDAVQPSPFSLGWFGQPAPGAEPAVFASAPWVRQPRIADVPAFAGSLETGMAGVVTSNDEGVWGPGAGGSTTLLAREGSGAPGTAPGSLFAGFGTPLSGRDGSVAFTALLQEGTGDVDATNANGLWLTDGAGGIALLAREAFQAPGTPTGSLFDQFRQLEPNDVGQLAFVAELRDGTGDVTATNAEGVWATNASGALELLARAGEPAPGAAPGSVFESFDGWSLRFDDLGRVVFHATLVVGSGDVTTANAVGIWLHDPATGLSLLVRQGDPVPDQPGSHFVDFPDGAPSAIYAKSLLSENGDVGFFAELQSGSPSLFQRSQSGAIVSVLTPGMTIEVSPGVMETIAGIPVSYPPVIGTFDMNAFGESAHVISTLESGGTVVVTSLPEAGAASMLGVGLVMLRWLDRGRRRRR